MSGEGCKCNAWNESECCCEGVDWRSNRDKALEALSDYVARHAFDEVVRHPANGRIIGSKKSDHLMKLVEGASCRPLLKIEVVTGRNAALTDNGGQR